MTGEEPPDIASTQRLDAEDLFRAHAPFVATFLRRLGTPAAEVDDAVQEVFLVTHRRGGYVPGPARPRTWLAAIAVRVAQARSRARTRRHEIADPNALELASVESADPAAALARREALGRVHNALQKLDLAHRAVFLLYEIDGDSCEAIAAALDLPIGTVYSRLHHARRRFLEAHGRLSSERPNHAVTQKVRGA